MKLQPRSCHKCPYNGKGDEICLQCPGFAEESNCGQSFVHIDAMPAPDEFVATRKREVRQNAGGGVTERLTAEMEQSLALILSSFMGMEDLDLVIFRHLYHGEDYTKTAQAIGKTKQYVSQRVYEMAHKHPIVTAVVNVMKRKGIGGATRGVRRDKKFQPDLFDVSQF